MNKAVQSKILQVGCALLATIGVIAMLGSGNAQAAKKSMEIPPESKATFMIMPELPKDNLGGDQLGYFNLKVKPNQERTIRIKVYNPTPQPLTVYGQATDATTNDNASIDYLGNHKINARLLPKSGSAWVTVPKKTALAAGDTKWVTAKVRTNNQFKGVKATAIVLSSAQINQKSAVQNKYQYAVGVLLTGEKLLKQDYQYIQSPSIKTRFVTNKKAAISVRVNNPDPMYLKKARIEVKLKNQKWGFIQYESKIKNGKIAPNSSFYVDSLLGGKRLVAGTYRMTLTTKNDHYSKTIHKYVLISKSQAKYINGLNAAYLQHRNTILGSAGVALLIMLVIALRIYRVRKRKKDRHAKDGQ